MLLVARIDILVDKLYDFTDEEYNLFQDEMNKDFLKMLDATKNYLHDILYEEEFTNKDFIKQFLGGIL